MVLAPDLSQGCNQAIGRGYSYFKTHLGLESLLPSSLSGSWQAVPVWLLARDFSLSHVGLFMAAVFPRAEREKVLKMKITVFSNLTLTVTCPLLLLFVILTNLFVERAIYMVGRAGGRDRRAPSWRRDHSAFQGIGITTPLLEYGNG